MALLKADIPFHQAIEFQDPSQLSIHSQQQLGAIQHCCTLLTLAFYKTCSDQSTVSLVPAIFKPYPQCPIVDSCVHDTPRVVELLRLDKLLLHS